MTDIPLTPREKRLTSEIARLRALLDEPVQTVDAIRRLKAIAAEKGFRLLPGHDPDVWPAFTTELGFANP